MTNRVDWRVTKGDRTWIFEAVSREAQGWCLLSGHDLTFKVAAPYGGDWLRIVKGKVEVKE